MLGAGVVGAGVVGAGVVGTGYKNVLYYLSNYLLCKKKKCQWNMVWSDIKNIFFIFLDLFFLVEYWYKQNIIGKFILYK